MDEFRCFLAHAKSDSDNQIDEWIDIIQVNLDALRLAKPSRVIAGRDDYAERFQSMGSWPSWQRSVAVGCRMDGSPQFHSIIVLSNRIGKATAQMASDAIARNKPVILWTGSGFKRVTAIRERDKKDWQTGWECVLAC